MSVTQLCLNNDVTFQSHSRNEIAYACVRRENGTGAYTWLRESRELVLHNERGAESETICKEFKRPLFELYDR